MLRGGRGGEVRLKLYLCLSLLASRRPYDVRSVPGRAWAETLALPDPEGLGARRVADALKWLGDNKFVALQRQQGAAPTVTLLDPRGTGDKYARRSPYVGLPLGLWRQQWITTLSGSAVALLIVLLDLQGGKKTPDDAPSLATDQRQRYALSGDTWTRATKELVASGLLTVRRIPQGRDFDWRRIRNTYWIHKERLDQPPFAAP
jgi:hypothetical protein